MTRRAVALVAPSVFMYLLAGFLLVRQGGNPLTDSEALLSLGFLGFAAVGAVVVARRVAPTLGWHFLTAGTLLALTSAADRYAAYSIRTGRDLPIDLAAAWIQNWAWFLPIGLIVTFGILLFPTGAVPGPRWHSVTRLAWISLALMTVGFALNPEPLDGFPNIANPTGIAFMETVPLAPLGFIGVLISAFLALVSLVIRFRRAYGAEREQMKWVFYAVSTMLALVLGLAPFGGAISESVTDLILGGAFTLVPVAFGIAILKYRLYDIDVIINRTLVYAVLTASVLAVYLLVVVTLSRVLDPITQDSDIAVAASTLFVAAVFRPLRARIQGFIDRRFYRRKYDSGQALHAFGARLRDEIEFEVVRSHVLGVVGETLQPAHASLWIKSGEAT